MSDYVERLKDLNFKTLDAWRICQFLRKHIGVAYLDALIKMMEGESDVGEI